MISKHIIWFERPAVLACDGRCDKAFGINGRPRTQLTSDPDDYIYRSDDEIGLAPPPGETATLSEGSDMKPSAMPLQDGERMNKWCARECERSTLAELPDMVRPEPNMSDRRRA